MSQIFITMGDRTEDTFFVCLFVIRKNTGTKPMQQIDMSLNFVYQHLLVDAKGRSQGVNGPNREIFPEFPVVLRKMETAPLCPVHLGPLASRFGRPGAFVTNNNNNVKTVHRKKYTVVPPKFLLDNAKTQKFFRAKQFCVELTILCNSVC